MTPLSLFKKKRPHRLTDKQLYVLLELYDSLKEDAVKAPWDARFALTLTELAQLKMIEYNLRIGYCITPVGMRVVEEHEKEKGVRT